MKELLPTISTWTESSKPFAVATVIRTWGSSPRPVGSTMLISAESEMSGSVSGGCVEGAVVKAAAELLKTGHGKRLHYGVTDDDAWAVGLSCGGKIQVYAQRYLAFDDRPEELEVRDALEKHLENDASCILITKLVDGPTEHCLVTPDGSTIGHEFPSEIVDAALEAYNKRTHDVAESGGTEFFLEVFPRMSQMLIIGAAHVTTHLVDLASQFGFETIVIDPRGAFAHKTRFIREPDKVHDVYPAEVLSDYTLDKHTYAVILSHDPKIDDNALQVLLPSEVAYIGALGSKKTHAKRSDRLRAHGFSEEDIARIHAPIGADINAKTPQEIALSILAEVIRVKNAYR